MREVGADRRAPGTAPAACGPPAPGRCRARIASRGERIATGWPSTQDAARIERVGAEDGARHLGAAGADQPGDAEDLAACAPSSDDVVRARWRAGRARCRGASGPRPRAPTSPGVARPRGARRARSTSRPTIMPDDAVDVGLGDRRRCRPAGRRAAPCSGRRSRNTSSSRWVTKMIARPCALQVADDAEELVDLGPAQRRGRLVHDDQPRLHRQRAGDLDHLLLGDRQVADRASSGSTVEADAVGDGARLGAPCAAS